MVHYPSPYRIQLDVSVAAEDVKCGLYDARAKPALPQGSGSLVSAIEILNVTLPKIAHQGRAGICSLRGEEQVHVVRHQTVRMHRTFMLFGQLAQMRQVHEVIVVLLEASDAVIATLNHVDCNTWNYEPQWPRHA